MTTSRPSLLPWTSTRRVARLPPKNKPRMVTCECFSAAASRLHSVMPAVLSLSWLAQESTASRYNVKVCILTSLVTTGSKVPVSGRTMRRHPSNTIFSWYVQLLNGRLSSPKW